jgi:hypothetical protein
MQAEADFNGKPRSHSFPRNTGVKEDRDKEDQDGSAT